VVVVVVVVGGGVVMVVLVGIGVGGAGGQYGMGWDSADVSCGMRCWGDHCLRLPHRTRERA